MPVHHEALLRRASELSAEDLSALRVQLERLAVSPPEHLAHSSKFEIAAVLVLTVLLAAASGDEGLFRERMAKVSDRAGEHEVVQVVAGLRHRVWAPSYDAHWVVALLASAIETQAAATANALCALEAEFAGDE